VPAKSTRLAQSARKIALCYIRQSYTRDADDLNSPDRQRANIEKVCKANSWTAEWYTDAEGHKSGRYESNRPGWLALKERIGNPDVVAVIANDFSRLHRKMARMSDLLDNCERFDGLCRKKRIVLEKRRIAFRNWKS